MLISNKPTSRHSELGFSLLEMAIVMFIISLLLGGLMMSLGASREISNRAETEALLQEIVESLYGFAQATGRLPCPATAVSNGQEDPVGGGVCNERYGFVPSNTLGLSGELNADGLLMDRWGSPVRYSVTNANNSAFTRNNGMRNRGMANLSPNLRVCANAGCGTIIADNLPVVLLSLGADWASFDGADVEETENSGEAVLSGYRMPNDRNFVSTGYIEDNFDDIVTWISTSILFTRMITAGQLP